MRHRVRSLAILLTVGATSAIPTIVLAHCPLCTAGAGAAALGAAWLGVGQGAIGVFIGAFGIAIGLWIARVWRVSFKGKASLFAVVSYLMTVLPLLPLLQDVSSIYIAIAGAYGTPLHTVYAYNEFLLGSIIGALVLAAAPTVHRRMATHRTPFPYQGIVVTFGLLLLAAFLTEILL